MNDQRSHQSTAPGWYPDPSGAPQSRWWDGTTWTDRTAPAGAPAVAPAKKKHTVRNVILGLVLLFILGVVGCTALLGGAAKKASDDIDKSKQQAAKEVVLDNCRTTSIGKEASGTVTNGSSKRSNYAIEVSFVDKDGNQVDSSAALVSNVEPGQRADWSAQSADDSAKTSEVSCKVVDVSRYASP